MRGKTVLVTGGNAGIGRETARALAAMGARVVLAVRDVAAGEAAARDVGGDTAVMRVDLARLADVRRFASEFRTREPRLDVLVNNAGFHTSKRVLTEDGHESTFAVNHLAHFLLTRELLAMHPSRIVTVASDAHRGGSLAFLDDPDMERASWSGIRAYSNSKLANVLFALELARRHPEVGSFAVHPGSVRTGWARGHESGVLRFGVALASPFLLSPEQGARTSVYAASAPELDGKTGLYLVKRRAVAPSGAAQNVDAARRLWELSEQLVAGTPA